MTHIMVDLETWGTTPGCDIRSIGAVVFDPIAGTLGETFYVNVYGGGIYGLHQDHETVKWWSEQSVEAQQALILDRVNIHEALASFASWWRKQQFGLTVASEQHADGEPNLVSPCVKFWANGPSFDEQILAACYRAVGIDCPWSYRAPRDMRTICEAAGGVDLPFEGVEHNALDDAVHQAKCVIEAYRKLRAPALLGINIRKAQAEYFRDRANWQAGQRISTAAAAFDRCVYEMGYKL